tara:strand:+ start:444 stop:560 length:117 start_codon:yes stop_codon:yes gene_type:complete
MARYVKYNIKKIFAGFNKFWQVIRLQARLLKALLEVYS